MMSKDTKKQFLYPGFTLTISFTLLCLTFISSTAAKEINPCAPATPFERDYGEDSFYFPFNSLVVFGDSYSDTGNIYFESNQTSFRPGRSWNGRYADGPVWVDYFATYFGLPRLVSKEEESLEILMTNYAYGGATTNSSYIKATSTYFVDSHVPAVNDQVQQYILDRSPRNSTDHRYFSTDSILHILFSGYNDYWYYVYRNYTVTVAGEQTQDMDFDSVASTVARSIVNNMDRLYNFGARMFMVMDMHDMTELPEAIDMNPQKRLAYVTLIHKHNQYLKEYINEFQTKKGNTIVYHPSAYTAFECIHKKSNSLGFYDTFNAFYDGSKVVYPIFTYRWWDLYHPTTHSHHYLSTRAIQTVYENTDFSATTKKAATRLWLLPLVLLAAVM